jgi:hypothetical protein
MPKRSAKKAKILDPPETDILTLLQLPVMIIKGARPTQRRNLFGSFLSCDTESNCTLPQIAIRFFRFLAQMRHRFTCCASKDKVFLTTWEALKLPYGQLDL